MYCQQNGNEQVYEQETVLPEIEKKDENLAQLSSNYHNENKNKDAFYDNIMTNSWR